MPMYFYSCERCDVDYEILVPLKQFGERIECPTCKEALVMRVSSPAFYIH